MPITGQGGDSYADAEQRVSLLRVLQAGMEGRALDGAEAEVHAELERRHGRGRNGGILVPLSAFERRANTLATAPDLVGTNTGLTCSLDRCVIPCWSRRLASAPLPTCPGTSISRNTVRACPWAGLLKVATCRNPVSRPMA